MSDNTPVALDISELAKYLEKVKDIASINKMMGAVYLRDFIQGQDVAGLMLSRAVQADIRAKAKLDHAEAIAYLEKASEYLKNNNIKDTSEARKMYISIDPDVLSAQDHKAKTEALVTLLKNKLNVLRQSHDDVKKIIYGDQKLTDYEGM